jgi:cystathionine beta-lyase/cystathionine gamma-synthase
LVEKELKYGPNSWICSRIMDRPTASGMETIKTASFESLIELAKQNPDGGYTFTLDGDIYQIEDVLEISKIASKHGYIVIY